MATKIFKSYDEFLNRQTWGDNGVSEEFAKMVPDFEKQNESNEVCWNCSGCSDCSGCSGCSDCSRCSDLKNARPVQSEEGNHIWNIPKIENIHQKVLEAVSKPEAFDMSTWHTCETTHYRAGWVVHLGGPAGYALEAQTSTQFAAMQIYKESSPIRVSPTRFFETNEVAMADIKRCAEEESKSIAQ